MTNTFSTVVTDIGKVLAWPFVHIARLTSIIATALKDWPAIRDALAGLMTQIQTLVADASTAAGDKGLDIDADIIAVQQGAALWKYVVNTFLPAIQAAYNAEVAAATKASVAGTKAAATRKTTSLVPPMPAGSRNPASTDPVKDESGASAT